MVPLFSFLRYIKNYHVTKNCFFGKDTKINFNVRLFNSSVGDYSSILSKTEINNSTIGNYCSIGTLNYVFNSSINNYSYTGLLTSIARTDIGSFCSIANKVSIGATKHPMDSVSTHPFTYRTEFGSLLGADKLSAQDDHESERTELGNDIWVGHGVIIMPGIKINHGAIIGAGAVVTKDIPPYSVVAGIPAKVIKFRTSSENIDKLLSIAWWNWSRDTIKNNINDFDNIDNFITKHF